MSYSFVTIRHRNHLSYKQFLTTFTTVITQHITQKDEINTICTQGGQIFGSHVARPWKKMERLAVRRYPGVELRMTYIDHGNIDGLLMVVSATTAWWFQISLFSRTQAMMLPTDSYRTEVSTGTKPREAKLDCLFENCPLKQIETTARR